MRQIERLWSQDADIYGLGSFFSLVLALTTTYAEDVDRNLLQGPMDTIYIRRSIDAAIPPNKMHSITGLIEATRPLTDVQDHLELVQKAVTSSAKNRDMPPIENGGLSENVLKWLDRSEASLTKDDHMIKKIRQYYTEKEGMKEQKYEQERANQKESKWEYLSGSERDANKERILMNVAARYYQEAQRYEIAIRAALRKGALKDQLEYLWTKQEHANDLEVMWLGRSDDEEEALTNAKFELKRFKAALDSEIKDGRQGRYAKEMEEYALNAIAWNRRAREIKEHLEKVYGKIEAGSRLAVDAEAWKALDNLLLV